jgi:hypothetical protein
MLWKHEPPRLAQREKRRDLLFAMTKGTWRLECSLLYHGEFGVEAQFTIDGGLHVARTFPMKALAVAWAESERRDRREDGWEPGAEAR